MNISNEIRNRIIVSVAAYAYEYIDEDERIYPIMNDAEYDALAHSINPDIDTGNVLLDNFFKTKYAPYTGSWIGEHPELDKIENIYKKYYAHARTA